ncbi:LacI family DNA-binding transcriptional regulator [Streptomyces sp. B22F1]|uniref:LacI family DNA-binding transcriptional regulator n=1 Tax=Streptomyces sp. B22F1 TaxID=3153566 RepID=UPI00325F014D
MAERAGASISTVSHLVNGTRSVAERIRQWVARPIEEIGCWQDALARSMRRSRTESVGL